MVPNRVLFIGQSASPIGGVETWLDRICRALAAEGWDPVVGLVRGLKHHRPDLYRAAHPDLPAVEIDGRGLPRDGRIRAVERCIRRVAPAVVVPLTLMDAHLAAVRAKTRRPDTRYLLSLRGNLPVMIAEVEPLLGAVDLAVCPGRLTCELLRWAGLPADRIRHVPNGADGPVAPRVPRRPGEPIRLGYAGRMTAEKRALDLEPFCRELSATGVPFVLDVAGDGPERARLEGSLAPWIERGAVRFHGPLPRETVQRELYPRLDCLVHFSASEAFGIALVEAMMNGVVPVSSRFVGAAAEGFLEDGVTALLFPVGDPGAGALRVAELAGEPARWERLSAAARARVEGTWSWARSEEGWLRAFREAVERPPRPAVPLPCAEGEPAGLLDRAGVPPGAVDLLRRMRRRLFGVPAAMRGGREWPFVYGGHAPERLAEIERAAAALDVPPVASAR